MVVYRLPKIPVRAHSVRSARAFCTVAASRVLRSCSSLRIWLSRTFVLSMVSTFTSSSFFNLYLFTPTITSFPLSIRACQQKNHYYFAHYKNSVFFLVENIIACFFAAHSSIFIFGMPWIMAFVMPPMASISSITFNASL